MESDMLKESNSRLKWIFAVTCIMIALAFMSSMYAHYGLGVDGTTSHHLLRSCALGNIGVSSSRIIHNFMMFKIDWIDRKLDLIAHKS